MSFLQEVSISSVESFKESVGVLSEYGSSQLIQFILSNFPQHAASLTILKLNSLLITEKCLYNYISLKNDRPLYEAVLSICADESIIYGVEILIMQFYYNPAAHYYFVVININDKNQFNGSKTLSIII